MLERYYGDFPNLKFTKTGHEVLTQVSGMLEAVRSKIAEREGRIKNAAKDSGLKNAEDVLLNLQAISEGTSGAGDIDMNVGIAAKVKAELRELGENRKEERRLNLIHKNLDPNGKFELNFQELTYFGFDR